MKQNFMVVFGDEDTKPKAAIRKIIESRFDPNNLTVTFVTERIKSWSSVREFFIENKTGLSDYLFDELDEQKKMAEFYKRRAAVHKKVSDDLKTENGLLRQRISKLERQSTQAKTNS